MSSKVQPPHESLGPKQCSEIFVHAQRMAMTKISNPSSPASMVPSKVGPPMCSELLGFLVDAVRAIQMEVPQGMCCKLWTPRQQMELIFIS